MDARESLTLTIATSVANRRRVLSRCTSKEIGGHGSLELQRVPEGRVRLLPLGCLDELFDFSTESPAERCWI
jgi:hypothetical protein